jgi:zinc protease
MKFYRLQRIGKRLSSITFLLFLFVSFILAQGGSGAPKTTDLASQVTEFETNGLKVLVKRRPSAPTVAASLFIRGGARNIDDKNAGVENLMLNVASEAGKNFPREIVRRELSRTGSSIGVTPGFDYSVVSLSTTRKDFDRTWEIFTDVILNPTFTTQDIERVREQILTGFREEETNPDNFLEVLQNRIIFSGHPYANRTIGNIDTVRRLTAEDLRAYHQKVMQTSQLLLIFVGDLEANDLKKRIADSFGKLPIGNYTEKTLPPLDFSKPTLDIVSRNLPTNYIQGVFDAPSLASPDYYAMQVAIIILRSRLFQEVRVKRQLSYAPNADLKSLAVNTANIYVTAVDANLAVSVMLDEIQKLKTALVDQDEIEGVSGLFLTTYFMRQQTNRAQAAELARYEILGGGWRNSFLFLDKIREVKDTDIRNVARKYMKNIRFVVIGNPSSLNRQIFLQN